MRPASSDTLAATAPAVPAPSSSRSSSAQVSAQASAEASRTSPERPAVSLDDKYSLERGRAFMSGVQALVRLPLLQRQRDVLQGKNTAGFISGYRGSPLGTYDQSLWKAKSYLEAKHIVFQPGVNEELAATALWGTQQLGFAPAGSNKYDGVFGIWYGKGPGVDRCSDVFKHANMAGTTPWGGVLAVAGDDHVAKSSTAAHQSDHIFKACGSPVFFPSNVQEILDLGLHAIAMSRFSGVWSGMKTIQDIVESSATVEIDPERVKIITPEFDMPPGGLHSRWPDNALAQEARLFDYKWYAALAYVRANRLNYNVIEGPNGGQGDRLGLIASGKAFNDTRQALLDLGLDDATCRRIGIRLHKVAVVWPLDAQLTREFAQGLQEILVIEEKRQIIEYQLKEELYNWRADVRPTVLGKFNDRAAESGADAVYGGGGEWAMDNPSANTLLRANADLNPALIAKAIAQRVLKLGVDADTQARIQSQLAILSAQEAQTQALSVRAERLPWFCSGCPHNTSTVVPEGSRAVGGIGCHFMVLWMDRSTDGFTQMGGEGVPWVGQQPFVNERHVFANLGDGTYFHSGILAVRQSIAAGVNITYKILYNDAVAMTGGQPVGERESEAGSLAASGHSVLQIARSLQSEGAKRIVVVTDEPDKYKGVALSDGQGEAVRVMHRDALDAVQRELREVAGCTIIIYDQTCATEKRRRRKRGTLPDPAVRVLINDLVCEGCGDCGEQSNCLSVEPIETEWGRKRQINQSTCNKDISCVKGFCPSFVTVEGGQLKSKSKAKTTLALPSTDLPTPTLPDITQPWGMVVAGVGGTGVITLGQLLGMAAHIEGKGVVTQDAAGLAQKGGATWSHVQIASHGDAIRTTRVSMAAADVVLGCDPIVTAGLETLQRVRTGRTHVALNTHSAPTAAFVRDANWHNPGQDCVADIVRAVGAERVAQVDAEHIAIQVLGDSLYANPLLLGFAWQKGWVPLGLDALMQAMTLNGMAVAQNKTAFAWGRHCAHDGSAVQALLAPSQVVQEVVHWQPREGVDALIAKRVAFLTDYQNAAYAETYRACVDRVREAEAPLHKTTLTQAVARSLFKLMAYKDEYEVARLHTDRAFLQKVSEAFEGDYKLHHHLAPPLLSKTNARGELQKQKFGPWVRRAFGVLKRLKGLRGTPFDVFGYTQERRSERAWVAQYQAWLAPLATGLNAGNHALALELARVPEQIKGFGHVKARHEAKAEQAWTSLLAQWRALR